MRLGPPPLQPFVSLLRALLPPLARNQISSLYEISAEVATGHFFSTGSLFSYPLSPHCTALCRVSCDLPPYSLTHFPPSIRTPVSHPFAAP